MSDPNLMALFGEDEPQEPEVRELIGDGCTIAVVHPDFDTDRIAEHLPCEVLGAAIESNGTVSVSIRIGGAFDRPGTRVEVDPVVIVAAIPARMLPR